MDSQGQPFTRVFLEVTDSNVCRSHAIAHAALGYYTTMQIRPSFPPLPPIAPKPPNMPPWSPNGHPPLPPGVPTGLSSKRRTQQILPDVERAAAGPEDQGTAVSESVPPLQHEQARLFPCADAAPSTIAEIAARFGLQLAGCAEVDAKGLCGHPIAAKLCAKTCLHCGSLRRAHRGLQSGDLQSGDLQNHIQNESVPLQCACYDATKLWIYRDGTPGLCIQRENNTAIEDKAIKPACDPAAPSYSLEQHHGMHYWVGPITSLTTCSLLWNKPTPASQMLESLVQRIPGASAEVNPGAGEIAEADGSSKTSAAI